MKFVFGILLCSAVVALQSGIANAVPLIDDNFEVDSSGDYTVVNWNDPGVEDGSVTFAFDYVAAGIPLAPRSTVGDVGGLRFTANDTDNGALDAEVYTAFHNAALPANVVITVDMYIGVTGFSGTTEYASVGAGGDGVKANSIFSGTEASGNFFAVDGDGDVTSDYRWNRPDGLGGRDIPSGTAPDPSYLAGGSNNSLQLYQDLFPGGTPAAGSPGNLWTTVEYKVHDGLTQISLDGTPIIRGPSIRGGIANGQSLPAGLASIGYGDVFSSVAQPFQGQFGIFDNFTVEESLTSIIPEPATGLMLVIGSVSLALGRRRR